MKKFKLAVLLFSIISLMVLSSCSASDKGAYGGYGGYPEGGYVTGDGAPMEGENPTNGNKPAPKPAGLITASAWNDNDNYSDWQSLFYLGQTPSENGKLANYLNGNDWGLNSLNRVKVSVLSGDKPISGAKVGAVSNGVVEFRGVTDAKGVAYLFPSSTSGEIVVESGDYTSNARFDEQTKDVQITLNGADYKRNVIELMLVVDVTGSMGDELEFLKAEISDVVRRIALSDDQTDIRLAMLFYRDHTDKEVFKYYDFISVCDEQAMAVQQSNIKSQIASGGGDWPEAVDEALEIAVSKNWSDTPTTKLIFHVLDAPPHTNQTAINRYSASVKKASEKGIRINPIIASGADELVEYLVRQTAVYTGGTFIFITDDSGIGNDHYEPNLPATTVECLNSLMVRIVKGYHTGDFGEAIDWRQEVK